MGCFKIDNGVRQSVTCPFGFSMGMGWMGVRFLEEGREWRVPGLFYADDLVLCGEWEEDLKAMVVRFVQLCRRRGLKVNVNKSKVMVMNGEEGLECEAHVDGMRLDHVTEFKYLVCVLAISGTDEAECRRKVTRGEGLQVLLSLWLMLEAACSLSVLGSCMRHCSGLFLCMAVRQ